MARTFNGTNQSLYNTSFSALAFLDNATISVWLKRAQSNSRAIFGAYGSGLADSFACILWTDGNAYVTFGNGNQNQYAYCAASGTDWIHFLLAFDGTQATSANRIKLWLDGAAQTLTFHADGTNIKTSNNLANLYAGKRPGTPDYAECSIALPGIWGATLTGTEATDLAAGTTDPGDYATDRIDWWPFDETSGNAAGGTYTLTAENNPGFEADPVGGGGGGGAPVVVPYRRTMVFPPPGNWARFHRGV